MITLANLNSEALSYVGADTTTTADTTDSTTKTTDGTTPTGTPLLSGNVPGFDAGMKEFEQKMKTSEKDAKAETQELLTDTEKGSMADWTSKAADAILNQYIPGRIDPNYNKNQAKNNVQGNLNRLNFNDTLDLSRKADALNNRRWWRGEDIGARTNSGFGSSSVGIGRSTKYEPIETEEMRQMTANRALDKYARERQIGRAETAKDYNQRLQENADKLRFELASRIGMSEVDLLRSMQNAAFEVKYTAPNRNYISTVAQNMIQRLALENKNEVIQLAAKLYKDNPVWADNYISNMLAGNMPSLKDSIESKAYSAIISAAGNDWYKAEQLINGLQLVLNTMMINQYAGGFSQFMPFARKD